MSKQANPTLVGAFVLGAIALGVGALLTLGSLDLFSRKLQAVLFFEGAVRGLNVGSPVTYRGVQVGRVVSIRLYVDPSTGDSLVPVSVELDPGIVRPLRSRSHRPDAVAGLRQLVEQGLKGRLETQSILTGLLLIELEHLPDDPIRLVGAGDEDEIEIPTVATLLQRLDKTLEELDLDKLVADVKGIVSGIEAIVSSPHIAQTLATLPPAIERYEELAQRLSTATDELAPLLSDTHAMVLRVGMRAEPSFDRVDGVLDGMQAAVDDVRRAVAGVETRLQGEDGVLRGIESAVDATGVALQSARDVLQEGSYVAPELRTALRELGLAARSLRLLAELLERRPEVLLRGK